CQGTSTGMGFQGSASRRYDMYRQRYTNCTFIDGNVEIVFLDDDDVKYDLSFLKDIREVTGYVLIVSVYADVPFLTNLRIIRGRKLFGHEGKEYSLYVALNYQKSAISKQVGLKELQFKSLYEIMKGNVFFYNNPFLCHANDILWDDILEEDVYFEETDDVPRRVCGSCHASCETYCLGNNDDPDKCRKYCWGEGPDMCQKLSRTICSPQCDGRCYGKEPNKCCHSQCAGGCTGPTSRECWSCKHFKDGNKCVAQCPPEMIYDDAEYSMVKNPNAKYAYGTLCVPKCPNHLMQNNGYCIKNCPPGKMEGKDKDAGKCVPCIGPCPKKCPGTTADEFVNSNNIQRFKDCTIIEGNLRILESSFTGDVHRNIVGIEPHELSVFESVREITEYLMVQSRHENLTTLSFLKNLEVIHGRATDQYGGAINLIGSCCIRALELISLKHIKNGNVLLYNNRQLCFVGSDSFNWSRLFTPGSDQKFGNKRNRPPSACTAAGEICDPQCTSDGCWGRGNNMCQACSNKQYKDICIEECLPSLGIFHAGDNTCEDCHEECAPVTRRNTFMCTGPNSNNCKRCKNVKDGPYCKAECPTMKYPNASNHCMKCHENCLEGAGCTGPNNTIGLGACNDCEISQAEDDNPNKIARCLAPDTENCAHGYFMKPRGERRICQKCHPQCDHCNGDGLGLCIGCKHFEQEGQCVSQCRKDYYPDLVEKACYRCSDECFGGCTGPNSTQCHVCKLLKVYIDEENNIFNCTSECPPDLLYDIQEEETDEKVCVNAQNPIIAAKLEQERKNDQQKIGIIVGSSVGSLVLLIAGVIILAYCCNERAKHKEQTTRITARMTGIHDENEPLTPTDAKPDLSQMRLAKESELRKGAIIGSGAFGTVYKGVWIPENEGVKIPVAIKVLQESTPNQNKELLDEARVMASVEHTYCVRILAVCMTAQMMLVTQLMPLGCLLDYVRKNKSNIGSKVLLNWCAQIAKGMSYLEGRGIVHRDLAARNVLVQGPNQVKITDFGLAKLLDYQEEEYHAAGGKMPIKWLALECIQHRIFTHKSDIWSFGVTVWELFTYGQRPYDNVRARDVPDLLEKGERLPQPSICTIDVYMIMIKCWMLDADSRPSFRELAEEFSKMARDPGRYLVIEGDKLMRLPSETYNNRDLVRSISDTNGPEEIVDAEEYLQPQNVISEEGTYDRQPILQLDFAEYPMANPMAMSPHKNSQGPMSPRRPMDYSDGRQQRSPRTPGAFPYNKGANVNLPKIRDKKYGHLEAAADNRGRGDSINSRYTSEPCQVFSMNDGRLREDDQPPVFSPPPPGTPSYHHHPSPLVDKYPRSNGQPLRLPVDEDDYLTPQSTSPSNYIDIIDGNVPSKDNKNYVNLQDQQEPSQENYLQMDSPDSPVNIDNPEYFQTGAPELQRGNPKSEPQNRTRTSSNQDQEHDYYNDFDKIKQMERQPLTIGNTGSESHV
ncbi:unnamed protein product, partial [Owenia fusiformis]